jgi:hypothetical protein
MKDYLKILGATFVIQAFTVAMALTVSRLLPVSSDGVYIIIIGYVCSLICCLIMALGTSGKWYKKLACIFLMPTNYTPALYIVFIMWLMEQFLEILLGA